MKELGKYKPYQQVGLVKDALVGSAMLTGLVHLEHFRDGKLIYEELGKNILPTEGLNHILNVVLGAVAKNATWYCAIFKSNVTPAAGDTAAAALGAAGTYGECQDADYTPATNRPEWVDGAVAGGVISNTASKASFTMAAAITLYGAFLASSQPKTATSGTLMAAKRFDSSRTVAISDVIQVGYTITATST